MPAPGDTGVFPGLLISLSAIDLPGAGAPPNNTLLVGLPFLLTITAQPDFQLQIPIPPGCNFAGLTLYVQGGYFRLIPGPSEIQLTDALEIVLGAE